MNKNSLANLNISNTKRKPCSYCAQPYTLANHKRHEKDCKLNPVQPVKEQKECPVCKNMHTKSGVTCGYSCSNTYFRSGKNNPNWKGSYRNVCFETHGKSCIVCGESKIVAVHHINEDHEDNRISNLVPLCPTHHQYVHSRYREEVQPFIDKFINGL